MNVKEVCQRLYDSSSGILAVGIAPWTGHEDKATMASIGGAFLSEPDSHRPWKDLILDAYRMWHHADRHRTVDRLTVQLDNITVVAVRRGPWVIVVGMLVGHGVRKSLQRFLNGSFKQLAMMEDRKVIPMWPADKPTERPGKGKGKGNLKPG